MDNDGHAGGNGAPPSRALLAVAGLSAAAFAAVTAQIVHGGGLSWGSHAVHEVGELASPSLDPAARAIGSLGGAEVVVVAGVVAVLALVLSRRIALAVFVAVAVAGAVVFAGLVGRTLGVASYPSVPTAGSTAAVLALVIVVWPTAWRRAAISAAVVVTLAVGTARLYIGADYASGVLAGWSFSLAWVAGLALVGRRRSEATASLEGSLVEPDLFLSFEALAERLRAQLRQVAEPDDEARLDAFLVAAGMSQILEDHLERDVLALRRVAAHLPGPAARLTLAVSRAASRMRDAGPAQRRLVERRPALAALLAELAEPLAGAPSGPHAGSAGAALAGIDRSPAALRRSIQRLPNCFRGFDQVPEDCAELVERFAERWPDRSRTVLVIGLRTSGSYLAPLYVSLLAAAGYRDVSAITLRPGVPISRSSTAALAATRAAGGIGLLVDDPPRTGAQFADAAAEAGRHGLTEVVLMLQLAEGAETQPERLRAMPAVVLPGEEWAFRRRFEPGALATSLAEVLSARSVVIESVDVLPPRRGHAVARVAARVDGVALDVHAEGVGAGYFGRHALAIADRLAEELPHVYGLRDGLLFREWLPEEQRLTPARVRAERRAVARTVAHYVATRSRRLPSAEDVAKRLGGREPVWEYAAALLADPFGGARKLVRPLTEPAARRIVRVARPAIGDARTQPWEWFGDGTSGFRKITFQQRATSNAGLPTSSYDPVYDLAEAAAAAEAVGDPGFAVELLSAYEAETGAAVEPERWLIHRLVHHLIAHRIAMRDATRGHDAVTSFTRALTLERVMAGIERRFVAGPAGTPPTSGPLYAIDIDGVLESRWSAFPALAPAGAAALEALRAHERRAVLATGRALEEVRDRCADYGLAGGVGEYGSVIYDAGTGEHRSLVAPADADALRALREVLARTPGVFLDPAHLYTVRAQVIAPGGAVRGLDPDAVSAALEAAGTGDRVRIAPGLRQTDFVAAGVDKARALRELATQLGAPRAGEREIAFAIGDTVEDLPMLALARSAWAPANASRELRGQVRFTRRPYQEGLLSAVRTEVGHPRSDCPACRLPGPKTREGVALRTSLTALGGGRQVKVRQALALAASLAWPRSSRA